MNLTSVRKQYDKLTPRERLAALLAADARGDEEEHTALAGSAPKVGYSVPHHWFLANAFEHLAIFHVACCLSTGCILMLGTYIDQLTITEEGERRIIGAGNALLAMDEAWRRFCQGEGLGFELALTDLPGTGRVSPGGPSNPDLLAYYLELARVYCPDGPKPEDVETLLEGFQGALKCMAG